MNCMHRMAYKVPQICLTLAHHECSNPTAVITPPEISPSNDRVRLIPSSFALCSSFPLYSLGGGKKEVCAHGLANAIS